MNSQIPSVLELEQRLRALSLAEVHAVSAGSGVPYRTLLNIRFGKTPNPGLETVRKFVPHLPALADTRGCAVAAVAAVASPGCPACPAPTVSMVAA